MRDNVRWMSPRTVRCKGQGAGMPSEKCWATYGSASEKQGCTCHRKDKSSSTCVRACPGERHGTWKKKQKRTKTYGPRHICFTVTPKPSHGDAAASSTRHRASPCFSRCGRFQLPTELPSYGIREISAAGALLNEGEICRQSHVERLSKREQGVIGHATLALRHPPPTVSQHPAPLLKLELLHQQAVFSEGELQPRHLRKVFHPRPFVALYTEGLALDLDSRYA